MHYPQVGGGGEKRGTIGVNMEKEADMSLPDKRLNERLERLVDQLSQKPESSLPQACGDWRETKAAYRFLG